MRETGRPNSSHFCLLDTARVSFPSSTNSLSLSLSHLLIVIACWNARNVAARGFAKDSVFSNGFDEGGGHRHHSFVNFFFFFRIDYLNVKREKFFSIDWITMKKKKKKIRQNLLQNAKDGNLEKNSGIVLWMNWQIQHECRVNTLKGQREERRAINH